MTQFGDRHLVVITLREWRNARTRRLCWRRCHPEWCRAWETDPIETVMRLICRMAGIALLPSLLSQRIAGIASIVPIDRPIGRTHTQCHQIIANIILDSIWFIPINANRLHNTFAQHLSSKWIINFSLKQIYFIPQNNCNKIDCIPHPKYLIRNHRDCDNSKTSKDGFTK